MSQEINRAIHEYNQNSPQETARLNPRAQLERLNVPTAELPYAAALYEKYLERQKGEARKLEIGVNFFPSAILSEAERREMLGAVDYAKDVKGKGELRNVASKTTLVLHQMDAGLGSSVVRLEYLKKHWHELGREGNPRLGAKGTDLLIPYNAETLEGEKPSVATISDIKLQRILHESPQYDRVVIRPGLNDETIGAMREVYLSPTLESRTKEEHKTFAQAFTERGVAFAEPILQTDLPTIDKETNQLTRDRQAPGGHGVFGYLIVDEISKNSHDADTPTVHAIYNGDGPNNFVTSEIVGFTVKERAGIVMLTTTKTGSDLKGGLLGVETATRDTDVTYPQLLEREQAKQVGQLDLFGQIGMPHSKLPKDIAGKHTPGEQYFNTNIALLNEGTLGPYLPKLRRKIGDEEFTRIISPDLIENEKEQGGRKFVQLEGAMGSALLNLNRYVQTNIEAKAMWKELNGDAPFLRIVNVGEQDRTDLFMPVKYPIDHAVASSDRFRLDVQSGILVDNRPGHNIVLGEEFATNKFYGDMSNIERAFNGTSMKDLDVLDLEGNIMVPDAQLRGTVKIHSSYQNPENDNIYNLNNPDVKRLPGLFKDNKLTLEDVAIDIDGQGKIIVTPLNIKK